MQATRVRLHLGPAIDWAVAAIFLLSTVGVAALIVRELRTAPRAAQPPVTAAPAALPLAVPARAVSVPSLLLADGRQIRVGDTLAHVNAIAPWRAAAGRETIDRGSLGERLTRAYEYQGTSFIVVFEPFERAGAPRVAAIYLP